MTAQTALSDEVDRDASGITSANRMAWAGFETRLRAYVGRRVDPLWADDVVGDILLRLVQLRDGLAAAANPLAWMLRVAANAVADHYRRRSVEKRAIVEIESRDDAPLEAPDTDRAAAEMARCLVPFIRALPAAYGEALMLTEIEGLTQTAAARRLGLSHSGMKSRVQRGRAKLRQALLRCCDIQVDRRGGVLDYEPRARGCGKAC